MQTLELKPVAAIPPDTRTRVADAVVRLAPAKAVPPPWRGKALRRMHGEMLLRGMVAACLAHARPNAEALARGSGDPEHVHQLRVGLRRLRSVVRGLGRFASALPAHWDSALQPVFDALGESRDRFVLDAELMPELRAAGAPALELAGPAGDELSARLLALVRGEQFERALAGLQAFADVQVPGRGEPGDGLAELVRALRKLSRQVAKAAMRFDELPFEAQHRTRKRLKRLRYLAEFAAPAFKRQDVKAWLRAVEAAQEALGALIDRRLAAQRFEALAQDDPRALFAAGWLKAKTDRSERAARRALGKLGRVDGFW